MKKLIIANWKMNPRTPFQAVSLASRVEHGLLGMNSGNFDVVICPPLPFLPLLRRAVHFSKLGAQNVAAEDKGPYTGEVSASQIKKFGVSYAIVGHSERRALGETDEQIKSKIKILLKKRVEPVLCVGYGIKKNANVQEIKRAIKNQLAKSLGGVPHKPHGIDIAYEPVWAISRGLGTSRAAGAKFAEEIIGFIKSLYPKTRVIYGGSIDARNATEFAKSKIIDGGLVGGASLKAAAFLRIAKAFSGDI
ncbi:triose-phosphate isomerase [bacterium]|nr:MAG: triose-phosphate isomerase [bacterium]